jgi:AbrB family looped-hinge helix DNA binding protein
MTARYKLKVDKQGRVVLPAPVRAAMGIEGGGQVTLELDEDEARLVSHRQALRRIQEIVRRHVPEGVLLSEELIADRRAEVEREDAGD